LVVLGILALALPAALGIFLYKNPFLTEVLSHIFHSALTSSKPSWNIYRVPDQGVELQNPYPFIWQKPRHRGGEKRSSILTGGSSTVNSSGFFTLVSIIRFSGTRIKTPGEIQRESLEYRMTHPMQGETYSSTSTTCAGLPATLVTHTHEGVTIYTMEMTNENCTFNFTIGTNGSDEQKEWMHRVFDSIKVETKPKGSS
jgi:hypothetical protein